MKPLFILASSSPRRKELLKSVGYCPDQFISPDVDETILKKEFPLVAAKRLAELKSKTIAQKFPEAVVLASDTIVARGRTILGKPKDRKEAHHFLELLSGRRHDVFTGISITTGMSTISKVVKTKVKFKRLVGSEIQLLLDANEWSDKSGAYALQGMAAAYITWINGSPSNVIGLPLCETHKMLSGFGVKQKLII